MNVRYEGAWLLVDNGYLERSTLIPPMKVYTTVAEERWSKWLEPMRKDVECTFGITEGRSVALGLMLQSLRSCILILCICGES